MTSFGETLTDNDVVLREAKCYATDSELWLETMYDTTEEQQKVISCSGVEVFLGEKPSALFSVYFKSLQ